MRPINDDVLADEAMERQRESIAEEEAAKRAELQLLTNSRMRSFRTCARLHDLRYNRGWVPVRESEALRFGKLMHQGLEAWWLWFKQAAEQPEMIGHDIVDQPDLAAHFVVTGVAADPFEGVRAEELLRGYHRRWEEDADLYEVVSVEQEFRAPLLNPATWKPSRTWRLGGKIDLLLRRRSDGRVLVGEHKTTVEEIRTDEAHYWSTLSLDHQISAYTLGAEALGHKVDEILYDVIRKVGLRPFLATPPELRKYVKATGLLYANQHDHDETIEEYRVRVRAEIESDPERYFQRRMIPRTESQLRDFMQDAWQQARSMHEQKLDGYSPRNPEACHRFGSCTYWSLCSTGAEPEAYPAEFVRVENVHPELQHKEEA